MIIDTGTGKPKIGSHMIKNNCVTSERELVMKFVILMLVSVTIAGCGTIAGTLRGAGEDIKTGTDTVADWVKPKK